MSFISFHIKTNQMHNISNLFYFGTTLYMFRTVSPSIIRSLRLYTQHQVYVIQVLWLATEPVWHIPDRISDLNPSGGMDVCRECRVLSCRGLCDGPITCPEESYRVWCVWVWSWSLYGCLLASCHRTYMTYTWCFMYSLKTPDDGRRDHPKHVECSLSFLPACCYIQFYYQPYALI